MASDTASAVDVYIHAAEFMRDEYDENTNSFMVLLPTAPLRKTEHIEEAITLFHANNSVTLISVTEAEVPPSWYLNIDNNGHLISSGFGVKDSIVKNRQNNQIYYIPNGAIYILDYNLLKENRTYYCDRTIPY